MRAWVLGRPKLFFKASICQKMEIINNMSSNLSHPFNATDSNYTTVFQKEVTLAFWHFFVITFVAFMNIMLFIVVIIRPYLREDGFYWIVSALAVSCIVQIGVVLPMRLVGQYAWELGSIFCEAVEGWEHLMFVARILLIINLNLHVVATMQDLKTQDARTYKQSPRYRKYHIIMVAYPVVFGLIAAAVFKSIGVEILSNRLMCLATAPSLMRIALNLLMVAGCFLTGCAMFGFTYYNSRTTARVSADLMATARAVFFVTLTITIPQLMLDFQDFQQAHIQFAWHYWDTSNTFWFKTASIGAAVIWWWLDRGINQSLHGRQPPPPPPPALTENQQNNLNEHIDLGPPPPYSV